MHITKHTAIIYTVKTGKNKWPEAFCYDPHHAFLTGSQTEARFEALWKNKDTVRPHILKIKVVSKTIFAREREKGEREGEGERVGPKVLWCIDSPPNPILSIFSETSNLCGRGGLGHCDPQTPPAWNEHLDSWS